MVVTVWKEAGFFMIFYLAALQQMSPHLAEAAAIEGASRWYFFRRVTLPLLMPTTLFVLVNAVINAFRLVDHVVVMTRGGPDNATELLLYYIYEIGFRFWDSAYAAALTMVLLLLLGLAALAAVRFRRAQGALPMSTAGEAKSSRGPEGAARATWRGRRGSFACRGGTTRPTSELHGHRPRQRARWLLGLSVDPAARLRGLDRVSLGRILDAFRAVGAADAGQFRQGVARSALRTLFSEHDLFCAR